MNVRDSMVDCMRCKQLNWYGYIRRMPQERIPRGIWKWCPPRRRGRGRLRNTWMQEKMTVMKAKGLEKENWNDRKRKIKL